MPVDMDRFLVSSIDGWLLSTSQLKLGGRRGAGREATRHQFLQIGAKTAKNISIYKYILVDVSIEPDRLDIPIEKIMVDLIINGDE